MSCINCYLTVLSYDLQLIYPAILDILSSQFCSFIDLLQLSVMFIECMLRE